jgi:ABC-type Co2+ transport system permease subunit
MRFVARLFTSLLWVGGGIVAFSIGQPLIGVVAIAYLVYLWVFRGRWLIY